MTLESDSNKVVFEVANFKIGSEHVASAADANRKPSNVLALQFVAGRFDPSVVEEGSGSPLVHPRNVRRRHPERP